MKYRSLAGNVTKLLSANAVGAVANVAALALVARALGPAGLGALALIEAYGRGVDRVVRLEPWQALMRYGVAPFDEGRTDDFRQLVKLSAVVDIAGATLAATLATLGLLVGSGWLGVDPQAVAVGIAFSLSLAFGLSSTPTAVLRMTRRFGLIARLTVLTSLVRLALTALAAAEGSFVAFGAALVASNVFSHLALMWVGWRELGRCGVTGVPAAPLRGVLARNRGFLRLVVNSNVSVIARQSTNRFAVLVVGAMVGAAEAGLFQLAQRIGVAAERLDSPLRQCVYPEFARFAAAGRIGALRRATLTINGAIAATGLAVLLIVAPFLPSLVGAAFGQAFVPAAPLVFFQLVGVTVYLMGSVLSPALYSLGADRVVVHVSLASAAVFFPVLVAAVEFIGITAATVANVAYSAVWVLCCGWVFLARTRAPALPAGALARQPATLGFEQVR